MSDLRTYACISSKSYFKRFIDLYPKYQYYSMNLIVSSMAKFKILKPPVKCSLVCGLKVCVLRMSKALS